MKIVLAHSKKIPVLRYGGTERVFWDLARALVDLGHSLTLLVPHGSQCDFARVVFDTATEQEKQALLAEADVVHGFSYPLSCNLQDTPVIYTQHGNLAAGERLQGNLIFVSANHADRHGSSHWVHNGLNFEGHFGPSPCLETRPTSARLHFLAKAAWRVKNVKGAIRVAQKAGLELDVMGGSRLNFSMGFRFTLSPSVRFHGDVEDAMKVAIAKTSKGLVFPVTWHEPFGLAVIESLYLGCPVFATPYGSLPELISPEVGFLSAQAEKLANAIATVSYSPQACHAYAKERFSAKSMALAYLHFYERVISGETLEMGVTSSSPSRGLAWTN